MENAINQQMQKLAHSIDPKDPIHDWREIAYVIKLPGRTREVIYRCAGCPLEQWRSA